MTKRRDTSGASPASDAFGRAAALLDRFKGSLPGLVVLDLDYTIWPYYCEFHSPSDRPSVYPEVPGIVEALRASGVKMAVASKSPARPTAEAMLKKLGFMDLFSAVTIFHRPSKHEHFRRIKEETGTALADMLFFDDEGYNIRTMSALGVTCVDVSRGGLSVVALEKGLSMHAESRMGQCGF